MSTEQIERLRALAAADLNWDRLLRLAAVHGLRPLVYRNLRTHCTSLAPETAMEQLHHAYRYNAVNALLLTTELEKILAALAENGIPVIPFKGVTLGERLYGDAALRESGDIDIIVPQDRVFEVRDLLVGLNYRPLFELSQRQEEEYVRGIHHYNLIHSTNSLSVEVHWDIVSPHMGIPIDWRGIWQRQATMTFQSATVNTLCPEDLFLALSIHGSKHRWEMLKWLTDVGQQIERNQSLDRSVIIDRARQWRVQRMVFLGIYLATELLEAPVPASIQEAAYNDPTVVDLAGEVFTILDQPDGTPAKELGRIAFLMRMRDRRQDGALYGWRLLTHLNFQDIDDDSRPEAAYYLQRPLRIIRKNGWKTLTRMGAQMLSTLDSRHR